MPKRQPHDLVYKPRESSPFVSGSKQDGRVLPATELPRRVCIRYAEDDLVTGRGQNLPIHKTHFGSNFWEVSKMSASTGNYFLPVIRSCRTGCNTDITYWKNSLKCMCLSPRTDDG